jgi:hypothetical protein
MNKHLHLGKFCIMWWKENPSSKWGRSKPHKQFWVGRLTFSYGFLGK